MDSIEAQDVKPIIGVMGMGKLGLPVALAIESKGYTVYGNDINPKIADYLIARKVPYKEEGLQSLLNNTNVSLLDTSELVSSCDIIFCAIQTPHEAKFEGTTKLSKDRADFDYTYLKQAVTRLATEASTQQKTIKLVVISTCLPGTFKREIKPLLNKYIDYVYEPLFIAMGTVLNDYLNPEFVLMGTESGVPDKQIVDFYQTIHTKPIFYTDITTAEGIKVFYNTFITMKTVLANTYGEMAEKLGMNVDHIYEALCLATDRIISPKYLKAGMSDGGGCHPRDNIALSYIAKKVGLSHNIFEDLMSAREDYEQWHADYAVDIAQKHELPLILLGKSFKPETNIETGSPAILMSNLLKEKHEHYENLDPSKVAVYFIATQHQKYNDYDFPEGSVIIDVFGYISDREGIEVIRIGRK